MVGYSGHTLGRSLSATSDDDNKQNSAAEPCGSTAVASHERPLCVAVVAAAAVIGRWRVVSASGVRSKYFQWLPRSFARRRDKNFLYPPATQRTSQLAHGLWWIRLRANPTVCPTKDTSVTVRRIANTEHRDAQHYLVVSARRAADFAATAVAFCSTKIIVTIVVGKHTNSKILVTVHVSHVHHTNTTVVAVVARRG